jgi:dipeptidase D
MERSPYTGLEPAELWRHFAALNAIPRPSGQEGAASEYVREIAEAAGAHWLADRRGNTLVRIPGRAGADAHETVAVQAHLDMVCESAPGVEQDFAHDPIAVRRDGDRIYAQGTTLGADNGIGVAAALALLTEPGGAHGPLELVFTVEEEIGLQGALHFDASLLRARSLINLDSEDDTALTVGSAGGSEILLRLPLALDRLPAGWAVAELRVSGLTGGHSGVQIHEHRANAIKLLVDVLDKLQRAGVQPRLASFEGGSAHNAIPRAGTVHLAIREDAQALAARVVADGVRELELEWGADEPGLSIQFEVMATPLRVAADDGTSSRLVTLLRDLPHGVIAMSSRFPGTVETSANLALVRTSTKQVEVLTSMRSSTLEELSGIESRVSALAAMAAASIETRGSYPAWPPREGSSLVACTVGAYRRVYGNEPRVEVVHGGLECGVLVANKPDLDAVSFGPLIKDAHTPGEHVYASTVTTTWQLLVTLLAELAANPATAGASVAPVL